MDFPRTIVDRQAEYFTAFDDRIRATLRSLVNDDIVEEHRLKPLGQHSDALDRLLNYFRRGGMAGKFGLLQEDRDKQLYKIVRFSGARGVLSTVEHDEVYPSLKDGYHAVFLRRIAELTSR